MSVEADLIAAAPTVAPEASVSIDAVHLEMRVSREVRYSIVHTRRPVFHPEERAIADIVGDRPVLLTIDRNVERLHGALIARHCAQHLNLAATVVIDSEETCKSWQQAERICAAAMECRLGRTGVIMTVGGGVALDLSGFAASIYRRGIGYLRIPTTLIGQVDVSVGVKQGVNVGRFKNVLGSFYAPLASINDVSLLNTLPTIHIAAGFAEIIKMAVIADSLLFDLIESSAAGLMASKFQHPAAAARSIMMRAEASMLRELKDNLFETDLKRAVDFGHSFSVAIETDSHYAIPHGHAVGLDMLISTCIAVARELCPRAVLDRLLAIFRTVDLPLSQAVCSAERLHDSLGSVRAHRGGHLNLVIPEDIGRPVFVQEVSVEELADALAFLAAADARF